MPSEEFTEDEVAEIVAHTQALAGMRPEERRAAELLKQLLDASAYIPRDVGGEQGMHDFDLQLDDATIFAVEVTTDTSQVDKAFYNQIEQPLQVSGLSRIWTVSLTVPGSDASDQPASAERVAQLKAELPSILLDFEQADLCEMSVPPAPHHDTLPIQAKLRNLGVQMCHSYDPSPTTPPRVLLQGPSVLSGATGPGLIIDAVQAAMPSKVGKLLNSKQAGASQAHLFLWLIYAQEHNRAASAMSFLRYTGTSELDPIDLQGIDAVWVAVDAGPSHAPCCRHMWPILCCDARGWHDWQLRRSH